MFTIDLERLSAWDVRVGSVSLTVQAQNVYGVSLCLCVYRLCAMLRVRATHVCVCRPSVSCVGGRGFAVQCVFCMS